MNHYNILIINMQIFRNIHVIIHSLHPRFPIGRNSHLYPLRPPREKASRHLHDAGRADFLYIFLEVS